MLDRYVNGKLAKDASEAMSEVLQGVMRCGGKAKGKLLIEVEVEALDNDMGTVEVSGNVKKKVPQPKYGGQVHYVNGLHAEGAPLYLSRESPEQIARMKKEKEDPKISQIDGQSLASGE
jgi:hypothetical protein